MCEDNRTEVAEFFLLGFQNLHRLKVLLFIIFLTSYVVIVNGNVIIVVLISINEQLKLPMFMFLKHLAIADLLVTTTIVPMILEIIIKEGITIPVIACIIQLHCFTAFAAVQCFLISAMSYDRYLAICKPMHYHLIMKPQMCLQMVAFSWLIGVLIATEYALLYQSQFCGKNTIDHFFCDFVPLLELSTSDISLLESIDLPLCILGIFAPFVFIIVTYVLISYTIVNLSSTSGRWKTFSTCSSHLATVCTYYGSLMIVYMAPSDGRSPNTNKLMSLFYIVATPMVNPIIYSLRNHEIRKSLRKYFRSCIKYFNYQLANKVTTR